MSNPSVEQLLAWMRGYSRTQGWSAIVAYDRRKTNELLAQLFIERFNSSSYLPPISTSMQAGSSVEHLYGLTFSVPQLSFEKANLSDSRAQLTLDFVGGMIITERNAAGGSPMLNKVQRVLPLNNPQLTMSVPLGQKQGEVNGGVVTLDIAAADQFKANFVISSLDQEEIGRRFQLFFKEEVDDAQKVYPLGTLTGENGVLTPEAFDIRTMPAPGATLRESANYSDGAVILFVKLREGTSGGYPGMGSDFLYPIPADSGDRRYSGTLLLSSHTLFEKVVRPHVQADIGPNFRFKAYQGGHDRAWALEGESGELAYELRYDYQVPVKEHDATFFCTPTLPFSQKEIPFTIKAGEGDKGIDIRWAGELSSPFSRVIEWDWPSGPEWDEGDLKHGHDLLLRFDIRLDQATGVVRFERSTDSYLNFVVRGHDWLPDLGGEHLSAINSKVHEFFEPKLNAFVERLSAPDIDTFLVRNLLFPGQHALRLSDAYVPGDMALFGHIDPARTSFKITPQRPLIEAGKKQQFSTEPPITGVTWSVRATDEADSNIGSIDTKGLYTAAPASALPGGYQRVVVSASGTLNGQAVTSSAMVSVVHSTVAVSPIFQAYGTEPIQLSADTLGGQAPTWSLKTPGNGGKLSATSGRECTYTEPPFDAAKDPIYIDTVVVTNPESKATTEAQMLVFNLDPVSTVVVSPASDPASGKVHLQFMTDNGPVDPDTVNATCQIITGGGSVSPAGVYQEPASAGGVAVVAVIRKSLGTRIGYIVLPLPLRTYGELIKRVYEPPSSDTWADYEPLNG